MTQATLDAPRGLVTLDDTASFPLIWLKDNDPAGFHPDTRERTADLMAVTADLTATHVRIEDDALRVLWADGSDSVLPLDWLAGPRPGRRRADPAEIPPVPWHADLGKDAIPRADAADLMTDDAGLLRWMRAASATGLALVTGLADDEEAGLDIARRIGFLRQTNFGTTFDVRSRPNPNNLAYTSDALPLHTDLPNQEVAPGFQFLHCLRNDADGGGSVFADGYAMAQVLKDRDEAAFARLRDMTIPFRFHDDEVDIRKRKPVIVEEEGRVTEICWNAHIADIFDMPAEVLPAYYAAYRAFMALTRDPGFQVALKLEAGHMAVFDNRRTLHGRAAFDPQTGARHLKGCYVDRGEWLSRIRVLSR